MNYEILSVTQFRIAYPEIYKRCFSYNSIRHPFCKAEVFRDALAGTFAVPLKSGDAEACNTSESASAAGSAITSPATQERISEKKIFGYCITGGKLIFIDDTDYVSTLAESMEAYEPNGEISPLPFLSALMEYMIKDDTPFLQKYEDRLEELEDIITGEKGNNDVDFEEAILSMRKDLSAFEMYYEQLSDMGDTLQQWAAEAEDRKSDLLFEIYGNKVKRLASLVVSLKEYSVQLRELRQSRIDIRQNQIMQLLTIITTIFMPLTLITGWYGMNFRNMPELTAPYAYGCVIALSVLVVIVEIILFKKKKWFK